MLQRLRREAVALFGIAGAAVTVLSQLRAVVPFAPWLEWLLDAWQGILRGLWKPPLELIGTSVHPHLIAALSMVLFLSMIGIGARISRWLGGAPLPPVRLGRWLDDQSWPSLAVFAALNVIFLFGQSPQDRTPPLELFGSREWGRYGFAVLVTTGYIIGDFVGHREFHLRLVRLAVLVAIIVGGNLAALYGLGHAGPGGS